MIAIASTEANPLSTVIEHTAVIDKEQTEQNYENHLFLHKNHNKVSENLLYHMEYKMVFNITKLMRMVRLLKSMQFS